MSEGPISLENVRRNRAWVRNYDRVDPILRAIEQAPHSDKKERLFTAACRLREMIDEGSLNRRQAWKLLIPTP
jgi:hypothetical protein